MFPDFTTAQFHTRRLVRSPGLHGGGSGGSSAARTEPDRVNFWTKMFAVVGFGGWVSEYKLAKLF